MQSFKNLNVTPPAHESSFHCVLLTIDRFRDLGHRRASHQIYLHDFPPLIFLLSVCHKRYHRPGLFCHHENPLPHQAERHRPRNSIQFVCRDVGTRLLFFGFDKTTSLTGTPPLRHGAHSRGDRRRDVLKEHVTKIERVGITIAFAGTLLTVAVPLFNGSSGSILGSLEGNGLIILSIFIDAIATLAPKLWSAAVFRPQH